MATDAWLRAHAYLEPLARFCARVDGVVAELQAHADLPRWEDYRADFEAGISLLRSSHVALELEPAGAMVGSLIDALASGSAQAKVELDARALQIELRGEPNGAQRIVDWLLGDEVLVPSSPGLARYLGWTALARYLRPVLDSFAGWRDEERWLRHYCPACGALPAMAQLVGVDPGRKRFLSCGCCGSRWRYRRTACPFCEQDSLRLGIVTVEGERELRIDYCESCRGYLKTYNGVGREALLLADWTSIHLDVVAQERGLKRLADSLYELDAVISR